MKYFTIEQWMGYQDLDSYEPGSWVAADRYAAYLESVQHLVPAEYTLLNETVYLHDSRLRHLEVDSRADSALLILDSARGDEPALWPAVSWVRRSQPSQSSLLPTAR